MALIEKSNPQLPVALVTGSARRIGLKLVRALHSADYRVIIHYRNSHEAALQLCTELNAIRQDSAAMVQANFAHFTEIESCAAASAAIFGRLDVIVNNASSFFPTVVGETTLLQWQEIFSSNLMAPYFLVQTALPFLQVNQGKVINIIDVHGQRPLKGYAVYSMAKSALMMLTKALARELGPSIQVNAIAPGITLWPEQQALSLEQRQQLVSRTVLDHPVFIQDIIAAMLFLLQQSSMTGEVINIDCGRLLK